MSDKRRLKSIASRYDLDVIQHRDPLRMMRSRFSYIFAVGSIVACLPWLFDHRVFQSHCVSNAHRAFEQNCNKCHDSNYVPLLRMVTFDNTLRSTSDKKCQSCHRESTSDHLQSQTFDDATEGTTRLRLEALEELFQSTFAKTGCASCHDEHRDSVKLAEVADAHCANCHNIAHGRISQKRFQLGFSDFQHHPEFGIWRNPALAGELREPELVKWEKEQPVDTAAIRFSHHRHLDPQLLTLGGKTTSLGCVDCHQSDPSGAYFRPINFEQHCHRCHKLGFPSTGELPHSKPEIIRDILLGSLVSNSKNKETLPTRVDEIGGPTKSPITPKIGANHSPTLEEHVDALVANELKKLLFESPQLERSDQSPRVAGLQEAACTKCHFAKRTEGASDTWTVVPPRMPTQWMENSRFRHDRHISVNCEVCHTRKGDRSDSTKREQFYPVMSKDLQLSTSIYASVSAQDVLMPRIDICRQCHGRYSSRSGLGSVSDRCVDCHAYHHTPVKSGARQGIVELLNVDRTGSKESNDKITTEGGP